MSDSLRTPPLAYTALAIAVYSGNLDHAAVALLAIAADNIAREENLPRVQAPAEEETWCAARKHQRR